MKPPRIVWVALALAACNNPPQVQITFIVPPQLSPCVGLVQATVLEPKEVGFSCDDIAFSRVPKDVLIGSAVVQLNSTPNGTLPVGFVDRSAQKIFLVTGLDDAGLAVVQGCTDAGEIDDDTVVNVPAEPATLASWMTTQGLGGTIGSGTFDLEGTVVGLCPAGGGSPLSGIAAEWSIDPTTGLGTGGGATSGQGGALQIASALPANPGPFVVDVRVRWANDNPSLFSGLAMRPPIPLQLPINAVDYRFGHIGPNREAGFAALTFLGEPDGGLPPPSLAIVGLLTPDGGAPISVGPDPSSPVLGLMEGQAPQPDQLFLVSGTSFNLVPPGGPEQPQPAYQPTPTNPPVAVFNAGVCEGDTSPSLLVERTDRSVWRYAPDGSLVSTTPWLAPGAAPLTLDGVGCVSDQGGNLLRTAMLTSVLPMQVTNSELLVENAAMPITWFGLSEGLVFPRSLQPNVEPFIASAFDLDGFAITRLSLVSGPGPENLQVESSEQVAGLPFSTGGGDLDGDGLLDLAAALVVPNADAGALEGQFLFVSLGRGHLTLEHVSGEFPLDPATHRAPYLWMGDVDGDGFDDIILAEQPVGGAVDGGSNIEIYLMGP